MIERIRYITIATSDKAGRPWNSPVFCAYDKNYTFYWVSAPTATHSRNIEQNPKVAIVIYNSTIPQGTGAINLTYSRGFGVYFRATASKVATKKEMGKAMMLLCKRKGRKLPELEQFLNDARPRRIYKAVPSRAWVNTWEKINGHEIDYRREIKLLKR